MSQCFVKSEHPTSDTICNKITEFGIVQINDKTPLIGLQYNV